MPQVINIKFLPTTSVHYQTKGYDNLQNDYYRGNGLILKQILSTNSRGKCMDISVENLCEDTIGL